MRAQGVNESDLRYATLLKILKTQSLHGHPMNPNPNYRPPATQSPSVTPKHSSAGKVAGNGINQYQLFQLKAQILAYKYLSRNMSLPPKLLAAVRAFSMKAMQHQQQNAQMQMHKQQQLVQQQQKLLQQHKQVHHLHFLLTP